VAAIGPDSAMVAAFVEDGGATDGKAAYDGHDRVAAFMVRDIAKEAAGGGTSAGRPWLPGETARTGRQRPDGRDATGCCSWPWKIFRPVCSRIFSSALVALGISVVSLRDGSHIHLQTDEPANAIDKRLGTEGFRACPPAPRLTRSRHSTTHRADHRFRQ